MIQGKKGKISGLTIMVILAFVLLLIVIILIRTKGRTSDLSPQAVPRIEKKTLPRIKAQLPQIEDIEPVGRLATELFPQEDVEAREIDEAEDGSERVMRLKDIPTEEITRLIEQEAAQGKAAQSQDSEELAISPSAEQMLQLKKKGLIIF